MPSIQKVSANFQYTLKKGGIAFLKKYVNTDGVHAMDVAVHHIDSKSGKFLIDRSGCSGTSEFVRKRFEAVKKSIESLSEKVVDLLY